MQFRYGANAGGPNNFLFPYSYIIREVRVPDACFLYSRDVSCGHSCLCVWVVKALGTFEPELPSLDSMPSGSLGSNSNHSRSSEGVISVRTS